MMAHVRSSLRYDFGDAIGPCRAEAQSIMAQRRRAPRAPFVQTIATAAIGVALTPACVNTVDDTESTNPPFVECPDEQPVAGTSCGNILAACDYVEAPDECGNQAGTRWTCEESAWVGESLFDGPSSCNPPFPTCPDEMPESGDSCSEEHELYGDPCPYTVDIGCGPQEEIATCEDGEWSVSFTTCNPPPPDPCVLQATPDACAQDPACRWLEPGCGEPALPGAGCFPASDCMPDACDAGLTCQTVIHDPCWNSACDACGAEVTVCLP